MSAVEEPQLPKGFSEFAALLERATGVLSDVEELTHKMDGTSLGSRVAALEEAQRRSEEEGASDRAVYATRESVKWLLLSHWVLAAVVVCLIVKEVMGG